VIDTTPIRRKLLQLAVTGRLSAECRVRDAEGVLTTTDSTDGRARTPSAPPGWKTVKLGDVCDILTGNVFDSKKFSKTGIKICGGLIIAPDGIKWGECKYWASTKGLEQYTLRANDVVVALDRPWISSGTKVGRIQGKDLPCLLIQRTARIRSDRIEPLLLELLIASDAFKDHCVPTGSTVPHISHKDIASFKIMLPPLAEQKAIVKRLEELLALEREIAADSAALDDLIAAAKRKILTLAMSGELVLKTSEWKTVKLGDLAETISNGTTPKAGNKAYQSDGAGFVRVENISSDGTVDFSNMRYVSLDCHNNELTRSILRQNDLLVTIAGSLGRVAVVPVAPFPLNTNQAVAFVRMRSDIGVSVDYLRYCVSAPGIQKLMLNQAKATGVPNLTLAIIRDLFIPLPPLAEQKAIVAKVEELFAILDAMKGAA